MLVSFSSECHIVTIITVILSHCQIQFPCIPNNHLRWLIPSKNKTLPHEPPTFTPSNDRLPSSQRQKTFQISLTKPHRRGRRKSGGAVLRFVIISKLDSRLCHSGGVFYSLISWPVFVVTVCLLRVSGAYRGIGGGRGVERALEGLYRGESSLVGFCWICLWSLVKRSGGCG